MPEQVKNIVELGGFRLGQSKQLYIIASGKAPRRPTRVIHYDKDGNITHDNWYQIPVKK